MDGQDVDAVDGPEPVAVAAMAVGTVPLSAMAAGDALGLLAGQVPPDVDAPADVWLAECAAVLDGCGLAVAAVADGLAMLEDVDAAVVMLEDVDSVGAPAVRQHLEQTAATVALLAATAARRWLALSGRLAYRHGPDAVDYADVEDALAAGLAAVQTWTERLAAMLPAEVLARLDVEDVDRG